MSWPLIRPLSSLKSVMSFFRADCHRARPRDCPRRTVGLPSRGKEKERLKFEKKKEKILLMGRKKGAGMTLPFACVSLKGALLFMCRHLHGRMMQIGPSLVKFGVLHGVLGNCECRAHVRFKMTVLDRATRRANGPADGVVWNASDPEASVLKMSAFPCRMHLCMSDIQRRP